MRKGWETKRISDVAVIVAGGTPKTKVSKYWDGEIAWITPADLGKLTNREVNITRRTITDEGLQKSSAKLFPEFSVILSSRAPIGHLAINTVPMATNQGCRGLVPKEDLDTIYLYYFLKSNVKLLNDLGTGATFKELSTKALGSVNIPFPPLNEQKQIVAILDQAFEAIDQAKANIEKNIENAKELQNSYKMKVFGKTDKANFVEFDSIVNLTRGHNPPKSDFIYEPKKGYVRFYQIRDGWSDKYKVYVPDTSKLHRVKENEMLMVAYRHIGKVFRGVNGAFNVALCKISNLDTSKLANDYLFELIPSSFIKDELLKISERSLIPSMSVKELAKLKVPLPPIEEQLKIVNQLENINDYTSNIISAYEKKDNDLDELKKSILQKAFSGELTKNHVIEVEDSLSMAAEPKPVYNN